MPSTARLIMILYNIMLNTYVLHHFSPTIYKLAYPLPSSLRWNASTTPTFTLSSLAIPLQVVVMPVLY
jgi:hypothetical protein